MTRMYLLTINGVATVFNAITLISLDTSTSYLVAPLIVMLVTNAICFSVLCLSKGSFSAHRKF